MDDPLHDMILDLEKTYRLRRQIEWSHVWLAGYVITGVLSIIFFLLLLASHQ